MNTTILSVYTYNNDNGQFIYTNDENVSFSPNDIAPDIDEGRDDGDQGDQFGVVSRLSINQCE